MHPDDVHHHLNEDIAAELPVQRDDEPSSLRQDILDELADHLLCAMQREQFASAGHTDEMTIWQRVLSRFGDPVQLARQLWFEAMKEKLMTQKLLTAIVVVLVVGMGYMLYAMNTALINSRDYQAMLAAQLNESQQRQEDLMTRLLTATESRSDANSSKQPSEWNNLSVKVVYDDEKRTPVVGAKVSFNVKTTQAQTVPPGVESTNAEGIADLGTVLYGEYFVSVFAPNGVSRQLISTSVRPGKDKLLEVVMPKAPTVPIRIAVPLPENIDELLSINPDRLWHSVTAMNSLSTAEGKWKTTGEHSHFPRLFVNSQGIVNRAVMTDDQELVFESVDQEERFDGLLSEQDQKIHRFSQDRYFINGPVEFSDAVEIPFGNHLGIRVHTYVEMDLSDGRKILTAVSDPTIPDVFDFKMMEDEERHDKANLDLGLVGGYGGGGYGPSGRQTNRFLSQFLPESNRPRFSVPNISVVPELADRLGDKPIYLQPKFEQLQMINLMMSLPAKGELVVLIVVKDGTVPNDAQNLFLKDFEEDLSAGETVDIVRGDSSLKIVEKVFIQWGMSNTGGGPITQYLVSLSDEQIEAIQEFTDQKLGLMPMLEIVKGDENSETETTE